MKVTITSQDGSTPPKEIDVSSGEEIKVKAGEKFHITPDADNPAVIILPSGTDLVVMMADGTWITLVGANDPGVVGDDGGIEVSIEGIGTVISAENSFTSYQGILLNNGINDGSSPFYEPVLSLNDFFLNGMLPLPVLMSLEDLFGIPGMPGVVTGDKLVFIGPIAPGVDPVEPEPEPEPDPVSNPGVAPCVGVTLFGNSAGGSTLLGTACDDGLFGFGSDNTLVGYAGDDTLRVTATDSFNLVVAPASVEEEGGKAYAEAGNNTLLGGDGNDNLAVLADANTIVTGPTKAYSFAGASASDNYLYATPGQDTLEVDASAEAAGTAYGFESFAFGVAGANSTDNFLKAGDGDDVLKVGAESHAEATSFADAESRAFALGGALANGNSLDGGDGNDTMTVSSESAAHADSSSYGEFGPGPEPELPEIFSLSFGKAYAEDNTLEGGDGNDVMSVTATSDTYSESTGYAFSAAGSFARGNELNGDDGNDALSVRASSTADVWSGIGGEKSYAESVVEFAALEGGDGADTLSVTAYSNASYSDGSRAEASAENNTLSGGAGDDLLLVRAESIAVSTSSTVANNSLLGGTGADTLDVIAIGSDAIANTLEGGDGNDVLSVMADGGTERNQNSNASNNVLEGERGDDLLTVSASASSGTGLVTANSNILRGGDGIDDLGNDTLEVTAMTSAYGNPVTANNNTLEGGKGYDNLTVRAIRPDDTGVVNVYANNNVLNGGDGNDVLEVSVVGVNGGVTGNTLIGGKGYDNLTVGAGNVQSAQSLIDGNTLDGGKGYDVLSVNGYGAVSLAGGIRNIEVLDLRNGKYNNVELNGTDVTAMTDGGNRLRVMTAGDEDIIDFSGWEYSGDLGDGYFEFSLAGGTAYLEVNVAQKDCAVSGGLNLTGGGAGGATLVGGLCEDTLTAFGSDNDLTGGSRADILDVSAAGTNDARVDRNFLSGGYGDDTLSVSANGIRRGFANSNTLSGGGGADRLSVSASGVYLAVADSNILSGGDGADTLSVSATTANTSGYESRANDNTLSGGAGDDNLSVSLSVSGPVSGSGIIADASYNALSGGAGADTLSVSVTTGADYAYGTGANSNTLTGGDGADDLEVSVSHSGPGNVYANSNSLTGGTGADNLEVNAAGADARRVYANSNTLSGGDGADTLSVSSTGAHTNYGNVTANFNSLSGGYGDDSLSVSVNNFDTGDATARANTLLGGGGADVLSVSATGIGIVETFGNTLLGGDGDDVLSVSVTGANAGAILNRLSGGDGDDVLALSADGTNGLMSANRLSGGADNDLLTVDANASTSVQQVLDSNTLDGGTGEDTLQIADGGAITGPGNISGIEVLDVQNGEINTITFTEADVIAMSDTDTLRIVGDSAMDTVNLSGWVFDSAAGGYGTFTSGSATVVTNIATVVTPIVLDLNGDGIADFTEIGGNRFDVDGDGELESISWAGAGDAVLAFDANGDGMISSLEEIAFASYVPGATSDLEGLSAFDTNSDGIFSAEDEDFGSFFLWQESNLDGVGSGLELVSLADAGIASINLDALNTEGYGAGHVFVQGTGEFTWEDGSTGQLADAIFLSQEIPTDLDGVLADEGGASEDEALLAAVDENGGGDGGGDGSGGGSEDVPVIPDPPSGEADPLDPTEDELAAV